MQKNFTVAALKLQIFCTTENLLYITGMNVINAKQFDCGFKVGMDNNKISCNDIT